VIPQAYPLLARTVNGRCWLVIGWTEALDPVAVPWEGGLATAATSEFRQYDGSTVVVVEDPIPAAPRSLRLREVAEWSAILADGDTA
jgi:hypothetical protein